MKFTNITTAMALFTSSFTWATTLPAEGNQMEELLNKFEVQQTEIDALKARVTILEGFEAWTESTVQKLPLWGN